MTKRLFVKPQMPESNRNKTRLDAIQKIVHQELKQDGFKKKGRTHNKTIGDGLIQVINFQMGQYPIGGYVIPGIRENLFGKFTVNLGVYIEEVYLSQGLEKVAFVQESSCTIRARLNQLIQGYDRWWELGEQYEKKAHEIIEGLKLQGKPWFEQIDNREKIIKYLQDDANKSFLEPRARLDAAIVQLDIDRQKGESLFKAYYESVDEKKPHKKYVESLAKRLNIRV